MNKDEIADFYSKHFDTILKELDNECKLLKEWFKKDFPESTLRIIVDVDNIRRSFSITTEVLSGKELANNQRAMTNKVTIEERDIIKPGFMKQFLKHMQHPYRQEIARAINAHYAREKNDG